MVEITRISPNIEINVNDSGIGITSDQIDDVYDRFLHSQKSKFPIKYLERSDE